MATSDNTPGALPPDDAYALIARKAKPAIAPVLSYQPPMPDDRSIGIGLIGAGGISATHLDAYRRYGFNVVAICDRHLDRATARRDAFFPNAAVTANPKDLIGDPAVRVLDITVHTDSREPLIRAALEAGQHVLSQKPFVRDLVAGQALVDLAAAKGLQLAVNQNGRWAPHLSYIREAVRADLVGSVTGVHTAIYWDHTWIKGTPFAEMTHVILDDFAIHWFDFLISIVGNSSHLVFATAARAREQTVATPLLSEVVVRFADGLASIVFDGNVRHGASDTTVVTGTRGTLRSTGPDLGHQSVSLSNADGVAHPELTGQWFNDGFAGTMGALLHAVETGREPLNSARENLISLRLSQAAIQSADSGQPVII